MVATAEIEKRRLLTHEEELSLGRTIQEGRAAKKRLASANGNFSPEETGQLKILIEEGTVARNRLVSENQGLVIKAANNYAMVSNIPFDDLRQFGNWGLIRAAEGFKPERNFKFSTYAVRCIHTNIVRGGRLESKGLILPADVNELAIKATKVSRRLAVGLEREPTDEEIAQEIGTNQEVLKRLRRAQQALTSLDKPIGGEPNGTSLLDLLIDHQSPDPEEETERSLVAEKSREIIAQLLKEVNLAPQEREVLDILYGLNGQKAAENLAQTAQRLTRKVSRERSRQIRNSALQKLKAHLSSHSELATQIQELLS